MVRPTLLPRFWERKEEVTSLRYKFRGISISSIIPLFVPISVHGLDRHFTVVFCLYRGSFNLSMGLDEASCAGLWSRPYFVALPFFIAFVVDRWSGAELSHPNFYHMNSVLTRTRRKVLSELRRFARTIRDIYGILVEWSIRLDQSLGRCV